MKWISVKEKLPDKECLAIGYQNEMIIGYVSRTRGIGFEAENEHEVLEEVTHWMPLPSPPIERGAGDDYPIIPQ